MHYCTMEWQHRPDGWAPRFPDGVSFLLLGDPGSESRWGLYSYTVDDAHRDWQPDAPVSPELAAVLDSSQRYPPALAITRERMTELHRGRRAARSEFLTAFEESLKALLRALPDCGYLMAPAQREEVGYLVPGEWYWLLGYSSPRREAVRWVSDDFFVYTNPVEYFDLGDGLSARLLVEDDQV